VRFKEGDKVVVRQWDDMAEEFGRSEMGNILCSCIFTSAMKHLCGGTFTIIEVHLTSYILAEDEDRFFFSDDMLVQLGETINDLDLDDSNIVDFLNNL